MQAGNMFEALPQALPDEVVQTLLAGEGVRIERIVSRGHASPEGFWYDQGEHEWVLLLAGSAVLQIEGEQGVRELLAGDYLLLPAHVRHRVVSTEAQRQTVWLAVFFH